jgi:hypothetical protein
MKPGVLLLAAAGAAVALTPALGAPGAASPKPRVKTVKGEVQALGMDGAIVAYGVKYLAECGGRVFFWNVQTNGGGVVSGKRTCEANSTSTGSGIVEVAVAASARRFAWLDNEGGNTESDDYLYSSSLPNPIERYVGMAMRTGNVDTGKLDGASLAGLTADGRIVAVSRYTTENEALVSGSLRLIGKKGLTMIARGVDSVISASASQGRIAVITSTRKINVLSSGGRLLRSFDVAEANGAAITSTELVVLTHASLQVFELSSGRLVHTWPAKRNGLSLDADSGFAAYRGRCEEARRCLQPIYVTRLSDGRTRVLARVDSRREFITGVELEPGGLVYATPSKIVRYSLKQLQAALG